MKKVLNKFLVYKKIAGLAQDIIFGQMRLVIATMDIEEINANRDKFLEKVQTNLEDELKKIGLKLINVNVTDITDESGYIQALGKEAAAKAINEAKISVADKNRQGEIGVAEAEKDQRIKVAGFKTDAEIGEANADQTKRTQTAAANALAIEGENKAAEKIANTTADKDVVVADARKRTTIAQKVKTAEALEESYKSEESAEKQRAERDKTTQYANEVVPAEIAKQKLIVEAEAQAESIRRIAKGEADAKFAKMEAEAKGLYEILSKQAEGFAKLVEASGGSADKAVQMMIADKFDKLLSIQVEAIKNVKFDSITVWDNGGNGDGTTSTGNFAKGLFSMLPPMKSLFEQVGAEMPEFMQGAGEKLKKELSVDVDSEKNLNNTQFIK